MLSVEIEENQIDKLLFYTNAKNATDAIHQIIQEYLLEKDHHLIIMQKKRLLKNIQSRFSNVPPEISLADELIAERHLESLQELK